MMKFIMLNPSTADALLDDPTVRRCVGFASAAGCGGILVFNLSPIRATNPAELPAFEDESVVVENERFIRESFITHPVGPVVVAWGAHKAANTRWVRMYGFLQNLLQNSDGTIYCLGTTKRGHPNHPLYLPAITKLVPWRGIVETERSEKI